jgi:hypothetical protein
MKAVAASRTDRSCSPWGWSSIYLTNTFKPCPTVAPFRRQTSSGGTAHISTKDYGGRVRTCHQLVGAIGGASSVDRRALRPTARISQPLHCGHLKRIWLNGAIPFTGPRTWAKLHSGRIFEELHQVITTPAKLRLSELPCHQQHKAQGGGNVPSLWRSQPLRVYPFVMWAVYRPDALSPSRSLPGVSIFGCCRERLKR